MRFANWLLQLPQSLKRITSDSSYLSEIDGLRFLAILPVVLLHCSERITKYSSTSFVADWASDPLSYMLSRGTVGVFLFFAISGFILGLPFAKSFRASRKPKSYGRFMLRRLTRLEPPYILWMTVCLLVLIVQGNYSTGELLSHFAASLAYVHNFVFGSYSIINPVAWSLEVEFQFYIVAPLLAYFFFKVCPPRISRILLVVLVLLWPLVKSMAGWEVMPYKASILGHLDHFLIGFIVVDWFLRRNTTRHQERNYTWDLVGIIAYSTLFFTWSSSILDGMVFNVSLLLVLISAMKGRIIGAFVRRPWIAAIGGMCYTIYLVHLPFFELLSYVSADWIVSDFYSVNMLFQLTWQIFLLLVFVIPAYLLFEKPFMNASLQDRLRTWFARLNRSTIRLSGRRALTLLIVILFATGLASQEDSVKVPVEILSVELNSPELIALKPLREIVAYAENNSPLLKASDLRQQDLDESLALIRREWTDYLFFNGNYNYGTSAYLDQTETPVVVDFRTLNRKVSLYNVGVSIRLPLSTVLTRGQKIRKVRTQKQIEEMTKEGIVSNIRQAVIREYNTFQNKVKVIAVKNDKAQSLAIAAQYAEKLLQDGQLDIVEYTTIISRQSQTLEELEDLRSEAMLAYLVLNDICGGEITQ